MLLALPPTATWWKVIPSLTSMCRHLVAKLRNPAQSPCWRRRSIEVESGWVGRRVGLDRRGEVCLLPKRLLGWVIAFLIGDEFHYLFSCHYFDDERQQLLGKKRVVNANKHTMMLPFNINRISKCKKNLAKFVQIVMEHFHKRYNSSLPDMSQETILSNLMLLNSRSGRLVSHPIRLFLYYLQLHFM